MSKNRTKDLFLSVTSLLGLADTKLVRKRLSINVLLKIRVCDFLEILLRISRTYRVFIVLVGLC